MPRRIIACTTPVVHCIDQCKDKHQLVDAEAEAAWGSGGRWQVVRLRQCAARRRGRRTVSGVYSINGGLDGLGLRAASLLATRGAIPLSLIAEWARVSWQARAVGAAVRACGGREADRVS